MKIPFSISSSLIATSPKKHHKMDPLTPSSVEPIIQGLSSLTGIGANNNYSSMGDLLTSVQLGANGSSMSSETNGFESNESSVCTNLSTDTVSEHCRFWIQGILLCTVGVIGMIGNTVSFFLIQNRCWLYGWCDPYPLLFWWLNGKKLE